MRAILALLLGANTLTLYEGPRPEETATYRDWITGCDNRRHCSAVALEPVHGAGIDRVDLLQTLIEQPVDRHLPPVITIRLPHGAEQEPQLVLRVDDQVVAFPSLVEGRIVLTGAPARALLHHMARGRMLMLFGDQGQILAQASLRGLTAALGRVDEQQGRSGTVDALVNKGPRREAALPGYSVSLGRNARSNRPPAVADPLSANALLADARCHDNDPAPIARAVRLDAESSMLIVPLPCGGGAYNLFSRIMIVDEYGQVQQARFDYDNGVTGDGPDNVLVNASWNDETRVLESFIKHRGIADCGRIDRYVWSGAQFMLSEQWLMPDCRSAFDRIRVWHADVADR